jgi:hypothetical protein
VKKTVSILFLFIYLVASTELGELFKVDNLIIHYFEHQDKTKNISFTDYIYHHYFDHGANDSDDEKDQNLPFNSHSELCSLITQTPYIPFNHSIVINLEPYYLENKNEPIIHKVRFYSCETPSIWQPPKLV